MCSVRISKTYTLQVGSSLELGAFCTAQALLSRDSATCRNPKKPRPWTRALRCLQRALCTPHHHCTLCVGALVPTELSASISAAAFCLKPPTKGNCWQWWQVHCKFVKITFLIKIVKGFCLENHERNVICYSSPPTFFFFGQSWHASRVSAERYCCMEKSAVGKFWKVHTAKNSANTNILSHFVLMLQWPQ